MTTPSAEPSWKAEAEAHKRAMPLQRLTGNGMDYADVVELYGLVDDGTYWSDAAARLGERNVGRAEDALALGHVATARSWFRAAAACFRVGQVPLLDDDPRKSSMYRQLIYAYGAAGELDDPPIEHVDIPWAGSALSGWLDEAAGQGQAPHRHRDGRLRRMARGISRRRASTSAPEVSPCSSWTAPDKARQGCSTDSTSATTWSTRSASSSTSRATTRDSRRSSGSGATAWAVTSPRALHASRLAHRSMRRQRWHGATRRNPRSLSAIHLEGHTSARNRRRRPCRCEAGGVRADRIATSPTSGVRSLSCTARLTRSFSSRTRASSYNGAASTDKTFEEWPDGDHCIYNHSHEKHVIVADWLADRLLPIARTAERRNCA